jgi:hypothetical protein
MICSEHMSRPTMKCKQFISVKTALQEITSKLEIYYLSEGLAVLRASVGNERQASS